MKRRLLLTRGHAILWLVVLLAGSLLRAEETAPGKPVFRIAVLAPFTGSAPSLGEYVRNGVTLAQEEIAAQYGQKLEVAVEFLDSKNSPTEGPNALSSAIARNRPDAVISAMSAVTKAVVPIIEKAQIPTIGTTTALTNLPKGTGQVVRVYPTSDDFVRPIADAMARKFKRVAVLYVNDDFGISNQEVFAKAMKAAGREISSSASFELAQADARTTIDKLLSTGPEAIFVTGYGKAFSDAFKGIRLSNPSLPIYTEIGFANPSILSGLGTDADGIIFDGTQMELDTPSDSRIAEFQKKYRARFNATPYQVAGFAYDSLLLLVSAAMHDGKYSKPTKASIIAQSPFRGSMGVIRFDKEGECQVDLVPMRRIGGKTVLLPR